MKTNKLFLTFVLAFMCWTTSNGQVGIGTQTPNPSAILDLTAINKGFLPPRMTSAERNAIVNPAEGLTIFNSTTKCAEFYNGSFWLSLCNNLIASGSCEGQPTSFSFMGKEYKPVESSGKCWLDRNLGASKAATSSTDSGAYGSLYQWGRGSDGHQLVLRFISEGVITSSNTALGATVATDTPPHGDFIITNASPFDWRVPQNANLWQGVAGINNPCPAGYRLPTEAELNVERTSWGSDNNTIGAINSPLKLPMAGYRIMNTGAIDEVGTNGYYWSSTAIGSVSRRLYINSSTTNINPNNRPFGYSVRCIKD